MMRPLILFALVLGLGAVEPVRIADLELRVPEALGADAEPPPGTRAAWHSADGLVGLAVVVRDEVPGADWSQRQVAELAAHAQGFELVADDAVDGWTRLRYRLDLGPIRFEQEARTRPHAGGLVVLTASWPLERAGEWGDLLDRVLVD